MPHITGTDGESNGKKGRFYKVPIDVCESRMDLIPDNDITFFLTESTEYEPIIIDHHEFDGYVVEKDSVLPVTIILKIPITFWPPPQQRTIAQKYREHAEKARNHNTMLIVFGKVPNKRMPA